MADGNGDTPEGLSQGVWVRPAPLQDDFGCVGTVGRKGKAGAEGPAMKLHPQS